MIESASRYDTTDVLRHTGSVASGTPIRPMVGTGLALSACMRKLGYQLFGIGCTQYGNGRVYRLSYRVLDPKAPVRRGDVLRRVLPKEVFDSIVADRMVHFLVGEGADDPFAFEPATVSVHLLGKPPEHPWETAIGVVSCSSRNDWVGRSSRVRQVPYTNVFHSALRAEAVAYAPLFRRLILAVYPP